HVINSEDPSIEDKVLIFESQLDDFFEYTKKKNQTNQPDSLREVKHQFPNLSAMAQDIIAIPATSIVSKQIFSYAGYIIDEECTLLDPSTIAALIY
ncbi:15509_t:CDS:2, partial [Dentiscutata erythropus]